MCPAPPAHPGQRVAFRCLSFTPPRKPRTRPRGPLCTHGPSAPAAGAPHEVWTRMRKTGFWQFTDTSPHDRGEKGSGPVVANEPKGTGDPGTQPLARRPPPGPASAALPEASTKTGVAEGAGWGQGASRPDWPAGRLTAAATTPRGLSRAGETPRACGVCKGRGRGNVECGPWGVGGGRADTGREGGSEPGPPHTPANSPTGRPTTGPRAPGARVPCQLSPGPPPRGVDGTCGHVEQCPQGPGAGGGGRPARRHHVTCWAHGADPTRPEAPGGPGVRPARPRRIDGHGT